MHYLFLIGDQSKSATLISCGVDKACLDYIELTEENLEAVKKGLYIYIYKETLSLSYCFVVFLPYQ